MRSAARTSRCRRSTSSAISAAAACCSPSAWSAGLLEAQKSGKGQVIDAAMVDGAALLLGGIYGMAGAGLWNDSDRETNMLDGGAHFYGTYETKDGKFVCIGSIEPQFYAELLQKTGLEGENLPAQMDRKAWAQLKSRLAGIFRTKTRDEWCTIMEGTDICFAPVLTMKEGFQASARQGTRRLCRRLGLPAARPRATLLAHQGEHQGSGRQARPAHRRGAERERLLGQGDRRAEGSRHDGRA
jgi:alpha-methylacyl-CoA racemase